MRRFIVRFDNEKDLSDFSKKVGVEITPLAKEIMLDTREVIDKRVVARNTQVSERYKLMEKLWRDMPEYKAEKKEPYARIEMFTSCENLESLSKLFEQDITERTKSIWFPKLVPGKNAKLRVVGGTSSTRYPMYVVSKNRHDNCSTSRFLSQMEVKHYVVVEPQDVDLYEEYVANKFARILEMDMRFQDEYDTFDDLGSTKSKGPGSARNFCWQHSIDNGHAWHWVMDDNTTEGFHYLNNNKKQKCRTGAIFQATEDFIDRFDNVAIAGLNYSKFCLENDKNPIYTLNTRIYSFLLIRNDINYRWRGRYNEDTDLSLRVLKDGWCTVQLNPFLAGKATTQKIKGGNTEEFYADEGTLPKSQMIEDMHPDVAKVVWKFNRWHHHVDYSGFTQQLKLKDEVKEAWLKELPPKVNNYGMVVIDTEETRTDDSKSFLEEKYQDEISLVKDGGVK